MSLCGARGEKKFPELLLQNTPKWLDNIEIWWLIILKSGDFTFMFIELLSEQSPLCFGTPSWYTAPPPGYNIWTTGCTWSSRMVQWSLAAVCPSSTSSRPAAQTITDPPYASIWACSRPGGKPLWGYSTPITLPDSEKTVKMDSSENNTRSALLSPLKPAFGISTSNQRFGYIAAQPWTLTLWSSRLTVLMEVQI